MPEEYPFRQRNLITQTINVILHTIVKNDGIQIEKLIAKLHVNPPFCSNETAAKYIKDMATDGKIKIDKAGRVFLCPKQ